MQLNYHLSRMIDQLTDAIVLLFKNRIERSTKRSVCIALLLFSVVSSKAQTTKLVFDVYFKDKSVGTVTALKVQTGDKIVEDLRTKTDSKVLMLEVHVESEINVTHHKNVLLKGIAYRHSNRGSEDIQSITVKHGDKAYVVEHNNKKQILNVSEINFCVIDLYFNEPLGKTSVFSNMYGQFINIVHQGAGKYKTVLPDGKNATYTYTDGKLEAIEVDMPVGKVISRRKN